MKRFWAEGIGTFVFVFAGCGAAAVGGKVLGPVGVALAFGLAFAAALLALGPASGAQLNPAVTVAQAIAGRLRARDVLPIVFAQIAGATLGVGLALVIAEGRPGGAPLVHEALSGGFGVSSPGFYGVKAALASEIGLSSILAFVLLASAPRKPSDGHVAQALAGFFVVTLVTLVGLPVTGLSAHPARALAVALLSPSVRLDQLWVFSFGPLVGGSIAALAVRVLRAPDPSSAPEPVAHGF